MVSPTFKCVIYILIAALTSLSTELAGIKEFADITPSKLFTIGVGIVLQSLIALRAFVDQSISKTQNDIDSIKS